MRLKGRLRAAVGRPSAPTPAARWAAFQAAVEPALAAAPRVHRFAAVPVIGEPSLSPEPIAVWVEATDETSQEEMDATLRSVGASTAGAVDILHGPLPYALSESRVERLLLLRAGDELAPLALERFGQAAALAPDAVVLTCDEDRLTAARSRTAPRVRPGPSPDRWLACDDSGALLVVDRAAAAASAAGLVGGGTWRHELALTLAGPGGTGHAHVPQFLCHVGAGSPVAPALGPEAVGRLLTRWEPGARVAVAADGLRRIRRPLGGEPSVELIVCLRDRPELLERCVASLLALTAYERVRLALVDNGSVEAETAALLTRFAADPRVRVLRDERPFNYAALNNLAAASSEADVLVLLNNDTEVTDPEWLTTLLEEAVRPEVGAVAPMLLYRDGSVQHAGAALGLHGYAGHPFAGLQPGAGTPFGRADGGTRNWLAVTAACVAVERAKFAAVGGFDETFVVAGNDVDLCLRLTAAGHRSLCVPWTTLIHDESRSRGAHIDPQDFVTSERSYGDFRTVGDPFYNPNLTLDGTDCAIRIPAVMGA